MSLCLEVVTLFLLKIIHVCYHQWGIPVTRYPHVVSFLRDTSRDDTLILSDSIRDGTLILNEMTFIQYHTTHNE